MIVRLDNPLGVIPTTHQHGPPRARRVRGGRRARGGGLGDLAGPADNYPAVYKNFLAARQAERARSIAALSGSILFASYAAELTRQASNAAKAAAQAEDISTITAAMRAEVAGIAAQLAGLAEAARAQASKTPMATITPRTALRLVTRLQDWYDSVAGVAIAHHDATVGTVAAAGKAILEAPKAILEYAGQTVGTGISAATGALGIPSWLVPVGVIIAGLVVAAPYIAPAARQFRGAFR